jgi:hypothetical protein
MGKKRGSIIQNYIARNQLDSKSADDLIYQADVSQRHLKQKDKDEISSKSVRSEIKTKQMKEKKIFIDKIKKS